MRVLAMTVTLTLTLLAGCQDDPANAPRTNNPAPVAPKPVPSPDGLPAGYTPPVGAKLVEKTDEGGVRTWSYGVSGRQPLEVAAALQQALTAGGWTTAMRTVEAGLVVWAHRDGAIVNALAMTTPPSNTLVTVVHNAGAKLLVSPPPAYPAGFPFPPFANFQGAKPSASGGQQLTFVYATTTPDFQREVLVAANQAGWQCTGDLSILTACRKASAEVTLSVKMLSPGKSAMFVHAE